jgi:hypothetical protein
MILHVFTEEASLKNVFDVLLPKILPENVSFHIHPHQGKRDLENALKDTIPSISKIPGARILITIDQDENDCIALKKRLTNLVSDTCACNYRVRIICRELESWFLGDLAAVEQAYHRFKASKYSNKSPFKAVDNIKKPSEQLRQLLPEYAKNISLPKLETSKKIAAFMNVNNNKSTSFNHTIDAIKNLCSDNA